MALDAKRQNQSGFDIFCCCGSKLEYDDDNLYNEDSVTPGECSEILS